MNLQSRLAKMTDKILPRVESKRRAERNRMLKGASWGEVLDAVEAAVAGEDGDVLAEIVGQVSEYESQPPRRYQLRGVWVEDHNFHGFRRWLRALQEGVSTLPDRLPRSYLESWRDGYVPLEAKKTRPWEPAPWCPQPASRCAECQLVLPGTGRWDDIGCPACGSREMERWDLAVAPATLRYIPIDRSSYAR